MMVGIYGQRKFLILISVFKSVENKHTLEAFLIFFKAVVLIFINCNKVFRICFHVYTQPGKWFLT